MSKTCIYLDRSWIKNSREEYIDDISLVNLEIDINNEEDPFNELPTPFFHRSIIPNRNIEFLLKTDKITYCKLISYDIPDFYILFERLTRWDMTTSIELEKKYIGGNPRATQICKKHKIWGPAIFFQKGKNLSMEFFIENVLKPSRTEKLEIPPNFGITSLLPKTEFNRYKIAQKYIQDLVNKNVLTYEDAWILISRQIRHQYVNNANPWFLAGPTFHSLYARANLFLQLTYGVKAKSNENKNADYLWEIMRVNPVLPENYKDLEEKIEIYNKKKTLPRLTLISYEEELEGRSRIIIKKTRPKKRRRRRRRKFK